MVGTVAVDYTWTYEKRVDFAAGGGLQDNLVCGAVGSIGCINFPDVVRVGIIERVGLRDVLASCAMIDEVSSAAYMQKDRFLRRMCSTDAA